MIAARTS
jgi:hypothetical protein